MMKALIRPVWGRDAFERSSDRTWRLQVRLPGEKPFLPAHESMKSSVT